MFYFSQTLPLSPIQSIVALNHPPGGTKKPPMKELRAYIKQMEN